MYLSLTKYCSPKDNFLTTFLHQNLREVSLSIEQTCSHPIPNPYWKSPNRSILPNSRSDMITTLFQYFFLIYIIHINSLPTNTLLKCNLIATNVGLCSKISLMFIISLHIYCQFFTILFFWRSIAIFTYSREINLNYMTF